MGLTGLADLSSYQFAVPVEVENGHVPAHFEDGGCLRSLGLVT